MRRLAPTDADAFRLLARSWAATVTVVTARQKPGAQLPGVGELDGFTATAFLTVSITPPLILVSANNEGSSRPMLNDPAGFVVNLLAPHQDELAGEFARTHVERPELWERVPWVADADGVPLLGGTVGAFSARVRQLIPAGDHTLVLGEVTAIHVNDAGESETLVYHNRGYRRFVRAKT